MTLPAPMPWDEPHRKPGFAYGLLGKAAGFWLLTALAGQWAFSWYIANFYGGALISGHYESWAVLKKWALGGYFPGDTLGNIAFGLHALAAGVIALGGALQFVPQIRNAWPAFHRFNGRLFLLTVTGLSLSGFYLVWVRHTTPDAFSGYSTTFNGMLILTFAALTWRNAVARRIDVHQRWALRLYLVSNAQWFLRIGLFGWFIANMAVGRKPHLSDPFLLFWTPGCYLVPLAVAELYLRARDNGGTAARVAVATLLLLLTLIMAVGAFAFAMFSLRILSGQPLQL